MSILLVLLIISFLILIHEFAHFLAAKKIGVKVEEFGFGYPPQAKKLFHWKGTDFTVNWLPFGGFVRLLGDSVETVEQGGADKSAKHTATKTQRIHEYPHNHFEGKSIPARLLVILAGAVVNIVIGVLAFTVIYTKIGIPTLLNFPKITTVEAGSPAEKAGILVGDEMLRIADVSVSGTDQFIAEVQKHRGQQVVIQFRRNGETKQLTAYVRKLEEIPEGQGSLGLVLRDMEYVHESWWKMPFLSMQQGLRDSWLFTKAIFSTLGSMFSRMVTKGEIPQEVSGPVGIVHMASKENLAQQGIFGALSFMGIISLNLGVMNLLPIPALDGGRAFFLLLERVLGKERRITWEQKANTLGMTVLLTLIVLISAKDVWGIFHP